MSGSPNERNKNEIKNDLLQKILNHIAYDFNIFNKFLKLGGGGETNFDLFLED